MVASSALATYHRSLNETQAGEALVGEQFLDGHNVAT